MLKRDYDFTLWSQLYIVNLYMYYLNANLHGKVT
jgi:hypothetical protein